MISLNVHDQLVLEDRDFVLRPAPPDGTWKYLLTYYGRPEQPPPPEPEMTHAEEMELFRIRRRSARARNLLVRKYLCWAFKIAAKLKGPRLEFNEAISAANAGLMEAIQGYNERSGYAFTTYSAIIIRRHIINALIATYPVKVTDHMRKKLARQARMSPKELQKQLPNGELKSLAEVFERLAEVPDFEVAQMFSRPEDSPAVPSESENPAEACEEESVTGELKAALAALTTLQRNAVLRHHYKGLAFEEIGQQLRMSKNTVRDAYDIGMVKLRQHLEGKR